MLPEAILKELSKQADYGMSRRPVKFVDVDPRVLSQLIGEIERHRETLLIVEKLKHVEPALRD